MDRRIPYSRLGLFLLLMGLAAPEIDMHDLYFFHAVVGQEQNLT